MSGGLAYPLSVLILLTCMCLQSRVTAQGRVAWAVSVHYLICALLGTGGRTTKLLAAKGSKTEQGRAVRVACQRAEEHAAVQKGQLCRSAPPACIGMTSLMYLHARSYPAVI